MNFDTLYADCVIVAVAHNEFKKIGLNQIKNLFEKGPNEEKVFIDVKGLYGVEDLKMSELKWWRLIVERRECCICIDCILNVYLTYCVLSLR